jgi:transcriptional regulator with XRE-family HTH domain
MAIDPKELGRSIAEVRGLRKMTQRVVSEHTGLTVNYLSLLENGERTPSIEVLNRLAETFRVPAEWLVFLGGTASEGEDPTIDDLAQATKEALLAAIAADTEVSETR